MNKFDYTWTQQFENKLREEYRIKKGWDYSYLNRAENLEVLCNPIWQQTINSVALEFGLKIVKFHDYKYGEK